MKVNEFSNKKIFEYLSKMPWNFSSLEQPKSIPIKITIRIAETIIGNILKGMLEPQNLKSFISITVSLIILKKQGLKTKR